MYVDPKSNRVILTQDHSENYNGYSGHFWCTLYLAVSLSPVRSNRMPLTASGQEVYLRQKIPNSACGTRIAEPNYNVHFEGCTMQAA
jgi:hypothetical protein